MTTKTILTTLRSMQKALSPPFPMNSIVTRRTPHHEMPTLPNPYHQTEVLP